jgi:quercetin 2,3-dioxygenase
MTLESPKQQLHATHAGILPGEPKPFYLDNGEGEKSVVFDTLFDILLTGDETEGQFDVFTCEGNEGQIIPAHIHPYTHEIFYVVDGAVHLWMDDEKGSKSDRVLTPGGFGYVPKGTIHAFRLESSNSKIMGVSSGGFGRFFHAMGRPTTKPGIPAPDEFYIPTYDQMRAAGELYGTVFRPDYSFLDD